MKCNQWNQMHMLLTSHAVIMMKAIGKWKSPPLDAHPIAHHAKVKIFHHSVIIIKDATEILLILVGTTHTTVPAITIMTGVVYRTSVITFSTIIVRALMTTMTIKIATTKIIRAIITIATTLHQPDCVKTIATLMFLGNNKSPLVVLFSPAKTFQMIIIVFNQMNTMIPTIEMILLTLMKNIVIVISAIMMITKRIRRYQLRAWQMGDTRNFRHYAHQTMLFIMIIGRSKIISSASMKMKMSAIEITIIILMTNIFKIIQLNLCPSRNICSMSRLQPMCITSQPHCFNVNSLNKWISKLSSIFNGRV